jgi:hypothetical protein
MPAAGEDLAVLELNFFLLLEGFFAMLHSYPGFSFRVLGRPGANRAGPSELVQEPTAVTRNSTILVRD